MVVTLLFLLAAAALPDEVPAEGLDLRAYYDRNRPYIWGLFAATLTWLLGVDFVTAAQAGKPLRPVLEGSLFEFVILGVFVSMAVVRRRWWHAIGFLTLARGPLGWISRSLG